eukprot:GHVL01044812.1.p1 GENE.GHVL01044812.1~~GHVL01044812.1.p1  ORF type:complete len:423 (+),score=20.80 GHVL01044812.1:1191-2459(+)
MSRYSPSNSSRIANSYNNVSSRRDSFGDRHKELFGRADLAARGSFRDSPSLRREACERFDVSHRSGGISPSSSSSLSSSKHGNRRCRRNQGDLGECSVVCHQGFGSSPLIVQSSNEDFDLAQINSQILFQKHRQARRMKAGASYAGKSSRFLHKKDKTFDETVLCHLQRRVLEVDPIIKNFSCGMPRLCVCTLDIEHLPIPIRNAVNFLTVTDIPQKLKTLKKFLPEPSIELGYTLPTLVLDLDETLMHCTQEALETSEDFLVHFEESNTVGHVYYRPFAKLFLQIVSKLFEVVIFTASTKNYADQVINQLDPQGIYVKHRLYRPHCTEVLGGYPKDLRLLGRDIKRCILVDNSPISIAFQPDNGILVNTWTGCFDDKELIDLLVLLQTLVTTNDIQSYLSSRYGFREFINTLRQRINCDPL